MPNRYIRASAIESEAVNSLSWQGEVFYRRLLNRVDDFGRYTANPALLRAAIFPLQLEKVGPRDIDRLLAECEAAGLLCRYEVQGKKCLVMNKWEKGRAKESEYPPPPDDVITRMQTYVYARKHMSAHAPDSDTDSDTDTVSDIPPPTAEVKAPRARNLVMDELATMAGIPLTEIGQAVAKRLNRVISQIRESTPDVTAEEVKRRAKNYRTHMPEAQLTPEALAKHWGVCHSPKAGAQTEPLRFTI
jgi:hypothetical protein